MSGFVASARLESVRPRLSRIDRDLVMTHPPVTPAAVQEGIVIVERASATAAPGVTLGERWQAIRERWSQATFFLFDADSWR
jgi:hypothetical protein